MPNKIQINLDMPKTKLDGAEEPTINILFKIDSRQFWICCLKGRSTEANRSISYQPKYTEIFLCDKCPRVLIWPTSRDTKMF